MTNGIPPIASHHLGIHGHSSIDVHSCSFASTWLAYFVFTQLQYLKSLPLSLYSMRLDLWSFWKSMNHLKELNQYESLVTNSFLLLLVRHMLLITSDALVTT